MCGKKDFLNLCIVQLLIRIDHPFSLVSYQIASWAGDFPQIRYILADAASFAGMPLNTRKVWSRFASRDGSVFIGIAPL